MDDKIEEIKTETIVKKKVPIIQIIFLILLVMAIAGLVYTTITIIKYKDMLGNPLGYNLEKFNINYCTCFYNSGSMFIIPATNSNVSIEELQKPYYQSSSKYEDKINITLR